MESTLKVLWTILAHDAPHPLLHCSRCGSQQPFRSSGRFRLNANGRRIDAWLIYKCSACEDTWNRALLERQAVSGVAPALLSALGANDTALARQIAFDIAGLRRHCTSMEQSSGAVVRKEIALQPAGETRRLEIRLAVPQPSALRLDRLLARELRLSRTRLQALCASQVVVVMPDGPRALKRALRDGTRILLDLVREADTAALAAAACPDPPAQ